MPDVIVIGAGAAGLACARELERRGLDVVVLEARDRIGGRVWTVRDLGEPIELGAWLIHGEHAVTWDLLEEAGVSAEPASWGRELLVARDGELIPASEIAERVAYPDSLEAELAAGDPADRPITEELAARGFDGLGRELSLLWFQLVYAADPRRLSALGVARVMREWESGEENFVIPDGYDRLFDHLARDVDVRLGSPVRGVTWSRGGVETSGLRASALVVTAPPSVVSAGGIGFDPPLPSWKSDAAGRIPLGGWLRVVAPLREPPPLDANVVVPGDLACHLRVDQDARLVRLGMGGPGAERASALGLAPRELIVRMADPWLPWLTEELIEDVWSADWCADPFSLGGYSYPAVGALEEPYAWARPVDGTLFFAGEATCGDVHPSTVHGAYESGVRAAAEVVDALSGARPGPR